MGILARTGGDDVAERLPNARQAVHYDAQRLLARHGFQPERILRVDSDCISWLKIGDGDPRTRLRTTWVWIEEVTNLKTKQTVEKECVETVPGLPCDPV